MSLELSQSNGITVKTGVSCSCCGPVNIYRSQHAAKKPNFPAFDASMTMHDFVCMVQYVLENTALEGKDDPRAIFVEYARTLTVKRIPKEGLRIVSDPRLAQKR